MSDLSFTKLKKRTQKIIQPVREEMAELGRAAIKQVAQKNEITPDSSSAVVEAMQQKSNINIDSEKIPDEERIAVMRNRIKKMQEEDEKQKRERLEDQNQWNQQQDQVMALSVKPGEPMESVTLPKKGTPKRGSAFLPGRSKKGPEIIKSGK